MLFQFWFFINGGTGYNTHPGAAKRLANYLQRPGVRPLSYIKWVKIP